MLEALDRLAPDHRDGRIESQAEEEWLKVHNTSRTIEAVD